MGTDPWGDDWREHAAQLAAGVEQSGRGGAVYSSKFHRRHPGGGFGRDRGGKRHAEPSNDPSRILGEHTDDEQHGAGGQSEHGHQCAASPQSHASNAQIG